MKSIILLFALTLSTNVLLSQNQEFQTYDLSPIVSIGISGEVFELDTASQGVNIYTISFRIENSNFIAQKFIIVDEDMESLPYDLPSLEKRYNGVIDGFIGDMNYELSSKELVTKYTFKGHHLKLVDESKKTVVEVEIYLLNNETYMFSYMNTEDFDEKEKDLFLNSIKINSDEKISQYLGTPQDARMAHEMGNIIGKVLLFGIVVYFMIKALRKRKSQSKEIN
jgi:hypothetical protein